MSGLFADFSWLTVIVSTLLCMALGYFWYAPKFPIGAIWAEAVGVDPEGPEEFPALAMGLNTLGLFLASIFVSAVSAPVAMLAILAYGILNTSGGLFAGNSVIVGIIHFGYWVVGMFVIIMIQAILG